MMRLMESMRTLPCPTQCSESSHIPQTSGCSRWIASAAFIIGTHHPCCSYTDRTQVSVMCAVTGLFHVLADSCRHA